MRVDVRLPEPLDGGPGVGSLTVGAEVGGGDVGDAGGEVAEPISTAVVGETAVGGATDA